MNSVIKQNSGISEKQKDRLKCCGFSIVSNNTNQTKQKKILLVDDSEYNRDITSDILSESGFSVETANDGTDAVKKMKNSKPGYYDLVLMDIQMPLLNGYEATKKIRELKNFRNATIPIIALSANNFEEDKLLAISYGMNAHLSKPLRISELQETLAKCI